MCSSCLFLDAVCRINDVIDIWTHMTAHSKMVTDSRCWPILTDERIIEQSMISIWDRQDELWANAHLIPPLFGKQEVGIWRVKKHFPRYGVHIWRLWPNIRFRFQVLTDFNGREDNWAINDQHLRYEENIWRWTKNNLLDYT
jgi:hypothetical protein